MVYNTLPKINPRNTNHTKKPDKPPNPWKVFFLTLIVSSIVLLSIMFAFGFSLPYNDELGWSGSNIKMMGQIEVAEHLGYDLYTNLDWIEVNFEKVSEGKTNVYDKYYNFYPDEDYIVYRVYGTLKQRVVSGLNKYETVTKSYSVRLQCFQWDSYKVDSISVT